MYSALADQKRKRVVLEVPQEGEGARLDQYAAEKFRLTRSQAQKRIREGTISLSGKKVRPKHILSQTDQIWYDEEEEYTFSAMPLDLDIVYEDEDVLVINKPPGLVVHPGAGTQGRTTLVEGVAHYLKSKGHDLPGEELRPGIVHRLDKDTSGVMVLAKNVSAQESLSLQFKQKTNLREYVALLDGVFDVERKGIESYLTRDARYRTRFTSISLDDFEHLDLEHKKGYRYAKSTFFKGRVYNNRISLVFVRLSTGRTHQIRIHSRELRMPIIGDTVYGQRVNLGRDFPKGAVTALENPPRQMLHAKTLGFTHPSSGEKLGFEVPLHSDFKSLLEILERELF